MRVAVVATCLWPEDGGSLTMTGTMEYAAPEVLEGESPSEQQEIRRVRAAKSTGDLDEAVCGAPQLAK